MKIELSPQEKITLKREADQSPGLAIVKAIGILSEQMTKMCEQGMAEMKNNMPQMINDCMKEGMKGEKGDAGMTPKKFVDYFTDDDLRQIIEHMRPLVTPVKGKNYFTKNDMGELVLQKGELASLQDFILQKARPKKGEDYFTKDDVTNFIKQVIPMIPRAKDGRTPKAGRDFPSLKQFIKMIRSEVAAIPQPEPIELDGGEEIVIKINELEITPAKQIDASHIKNLGKYMKEKSPRRMGGGGDIINMYDLSSLADGSTKTFSVPFHRKALAIIGSDFPTILIENNGFIVSSGKTQITTTYQNAASQGSQLAFLYVR